jgi:hypothetical protein
MGESQGKGRASERYFSVVIIIKHDLIIDFGVGNIKVSVSCELL